MKNNNTTKTSKDPNISSAEMTAIWRTSELSRDNLSCKMSSEAGYRKSREFINSFNYPLIARKISVRAEYFLTNVSKLIKTGKYDGCISFASGFSLLTYFSALENAESKIRFVDSDLPHIMQERKHRLDNIMQDLDPTTLAKITNKDLDLEKACNENKSFQSLFPEFNAPIFIIEGVIYFLTQKCVDWIMDNINKYEKAAVILDYWAEDGVEKSTCFAELIAKLGDNFMPEKIQSFRFKGSLSKIHTVFSSIKDTTIQEAEAELIKNKSNEQRMLIDQNNFYPVHLVTAERTVTK